MDCDFESASRYARIRSLAEAASCLHGDSLPACKRRRAEIVYDLLDTIELLAMMGSFEAGSPPDPPEPPAS
ncbi:MAG TPA: hypothetical protein PLN31_09490 [Azoarcus taiwanensis]|nr:hypothetical protein [Azoarcus taiwanensis]